MHDVKHNTEPALAFDVRRTTDGSLPRVAYLDCFSGISGDMFLGALIDSGVSQELLRHAVESLKIGATLEITQVNRSGISATKVEVVVNGKKERPRGLADDHSPEPHSHAGHGHGHTHSHPHAPDHQHSQSEYAPFEHFHTHAEEHGRGLNDIRRIIATAAISESAKSTASTVFERLGAAEAKIHNVPTDKIHFHEVGAVDAIVDIVCAAVGAEALGVDEFVCSPLNVGGGSVVCAHGTFPVPAPATVELLRGVPVYSSGIQAELVTPTGAAIVTTLAKRFENFPLMKIEKSGYGAGTRDFPGQPNVLRIVVGESIANAADKNVEPALSDRLEGGSRTGPTQAEEDTVVVLEANLDDLNPQVFGYVMDRLLEAGALDVFGTAVQMKKNRPGTLLTVLAKPGQADELAKIIFAETTTLGVRRREERRQVLAREWVAVVTRFGEIRVKTASLNGSVSSYAPEYEDCRRAAAAHRVPLKQVMQEAMQAYLQASHKAFTTKVMK